MSFCAKCGAQVTAGGAFCTRCGEPLEPMPGLVATGTRRPSAETIATEEQRLMKLLRDATLGEYEIATEIGRGGMAVVYLGHDLALDRKVAIKVMTPALTLMDQGIQERFKREARTAASLSHPNVIPVFAVKETQSIVYFVMKYVVGRSLESVMEDVGALPIPVAQTILGQIGAGLGYAHRQGVVHRDMKPGNVMLDEEGWVVVTDFGIAKVARAEALTATGGMVGTPTYMSPEQCAGGDVTGLADQYSVGIMAYEMLAGRQPFSGDSLVNLIYDHCHTAPPPLLDARPDCPPDIADAVMRMLAKDPADRWPTIEEAVTAIGIGAEGHADTVRTQLQTIVQAGTAERLLEKFRTPGSPIPQSSAGIKRTAAPKAATPPSEAAIPTSRRWRWPALGATAVLVAALGWFVLRPGGDTAPVDSAPAQGEAAVPDAAAAGLDVAPLSVTLAPGERVLLRAIARDSNGSVIPNAGTIWQSSAPTIATVAQDGEVTAVAAGTVQIRVRSGASSATAVVTVRRLIAEPTRAAPAVTQAPVRPETTALAATDSQAPPEVEGEPDPQPIDAPAREITPPVVEAAPAPAPEPDHRPAIERVIEAYRQAIESRDLRRLRAAYPGLTSNQEQAWREFFGGVTELTAVLDIESLTVDADQATVRIAARYEFRSGRQQTQHLGLTATLQRGPTGWRIVAIE